MAFVNGLTYSKADTRKSNRLSNLEKRILAASFGQAPYHRQEETQSARDIAS